MQKCKYSIAGKCTNDSVACELCDGLDISQRACRPFQLSVFRTGEIWLKEVEETVDDVKKKISSCDCCAGDAPLYYVDNENCVFVDNTGEIMTVAKDKTIRYKVKYCPNCGRKF